MHIDLTPLYGYTRRLPPRGIHFHPDYDIVGLATYQRAVNPPVVAPSRFSRYNTIFQSDSDPIDLLVTGVDDAVLYSVAGIPVSWLKQVYRFLADHYRVRVAQEQCHSNACQAVVRLDVTPAEFEEFYQWKTHRQF